MILLPLSFSRPFLNPQGTSNIIDHNNTSHTLQNRHIARLDYGRDESDHDKTNFSFAIETALVLSRVSWSRIEKDSAAVSRNHQFQQSQWHHHCILLSSEYECGFVRREVLFCASRK
jgi:hypothetical protein